MLRRDASHLLRSRAAVHVGVVPERHLDVLMAHDVLQRLRVHPRLRHLRAERVAQRVGCHALGKLHVPALRALAPQPPEHPVVITADPRQPVPVEEDEARAPIDAHGLRLRPRCHDMLERGHHLVGHVDVALAALRLRLIDPVSPADRAGELVVHENHPVRQVDVRLGQPAHLRDAKTRPEEDDHLVGVPVVDGITMSWEPTALERNDGTCPRDTNGIRPEDDFCLGCYKRFAQGTAPTTRASIAVSLSRALPGREG